MPIGSVFTDKNAEVSQDNDFMSKIVETAKKGIGKIKYVFGGDNISDDMTGEGDCSDFTQKVFKLATGEDIGGTTEEQYMKGETISDMSELKQGDLVFFKDTYASGYTDGVSHVGIYIGDGQFIHNSSGSGGVVISDLDGNSGYYQNHWLTGKRIFEDGSFTYTPDSVKDTASKDTNWLGDIITILLIVVIIAIAIIFFIKSFNQK